MKVHLLVLTLLSLGTTAFAKEALVIESGVTNTYSAYAAADGSTNPFKNGVAMPQVVASAQSEKDMKIANLKIQIEQQQNSYDEKIVYLQDELKKSKERLIEKSINTEKLQANVEKRYDEETSFLKKELVAKTKTLMEYQRQLEKVKLSDEMKNILKANTELAVELRRSNDKLAIVQLQATEAIAKKEIPTQQSGGRMPASVEQK